MSHNPYQRFLRNESILRDELAINRTILANERTLLAYIRTALTLIIAGVSFLHFVESGPLRELGAVFAVAGVLAGGYGFHRFGRMKQHIKSAWQHPPVSAANPGSQSPDSQ